MSQDASVTLKLDTSSLNAEEGTSESTALFEVKDTAKELRGSASELAGLLTAAQECMARHAAKADAYHDACLTLMEKHANSSRRPLQAQLDEANAINSDLEARLRSLNEKVSKLEAERSQLQAFKDSITGMVQSSLAGTHASTPTAPPKVSAESSAEVLVTSTPLTSEGIANLKSSLVPKAKEAVQEDQPSENAQPKTIPAAATTSPGAQAHQDAADPDSLPSQAEQDKSPSEGEKGGTADGAASPIAAVGGGMDDTVEGIVVEPADDAAPAEVVTSHPSAAASGGTSHSPNKSEPPAFEDVNRDGALQLVQLSSRSCVPVPAGGMVLGRSTATSHKIDDLGLKVHRKHIRLSIQQGPDGTAAIAVQRLGLNAASVIQEKDAQALGLLHADGSLAAADVDVASIVADAEAKECVHAIAKKHARSVSVGDVLVLCHSLQGAFHLQHDKQAPAKRGIKRERTDDGELPPNSSKSSKIMH